MDPLAPTTVRVLETREGYDAWSTIYDGEGNPLVVLEERALPALLGEVGGKTIADIGCGTGRHATRLAIAGASVTAVDFSPGMLAKARAKPGGDRVRFLEHDITRRLPFEDRAFDIVICCLVVDHIQDLRGLFTELARLCRADGPGFDGGFAVVTVMHPAMMLRGVQARFVDPSTGLETRPRSVPNRISDYVRAAARSGLVFEDMSEYPADESLAQAAPRAEKYLGWPMLLTMKLRPCRGSEGR